MRFWAISCMVLGLNSPTSTGRRPSVQIGSSEHTVGAMIECVAGKASPEFTVTSQESLPIGSSTALSVLDVNGVQRVK